MVPVIAMHTAFVGSFATFISTILPPTTTKPCRTRIGVHHSLISGPFSTVAWTCVGYTESPGIATATATANQNDNAIAAAAVVRRDLLLVVDDGRREFRTRFTLTSSLPNCRSWSSMRNKRTTTPKRKKMTTTAILH